MWAEITEVNVEDFCFIIKKGISAISERRQMKKYEKLTNEILFCSIIANMSFERLML